ncbi:MAG: polysaccharide deacetylase family protein [Clostridiaceae bacterium]|nr:polysaccharide deacetylase family protein [Eubacteriales bacterium]
MKKRRIGKIADLLVNALLIALIAALYIVTSGPEVQTAMAEAYGSPVYRGRAEGKIALQFAVNWNAQAMGDILDTLKANSARVTFAVSGRWAEENPDMLKRICDEGHELATMGYDTSLDGRLSWVTEDVRRSLEAIETLSGATVKLYYSGIRSLAVSSAAAEALSLTHVLCTADLLCARGTAEDIIARALQNPIDGSILLMQPTAAAAEALQGLIAALQEKGIRVAATADVL